MEVHHHSHAHGKKNWISYLREFLMLFLAVFCGFLAEYQLEHKIERDRAKQFAVSLQQDLAADTLVFNRVMDNLAYCARNTDTLIRILGQPGSALNRTKEIYRLSVYAFILPAADINESTLQQLLNSGSLRYFRDDSLVAGIKKYNSRVQSTREFGSASQLFNTEFRKAQAGILEISPLLQFIRNYEFLNRQNYITGEGYEIFEGYQLLSTDPLKLKEYANWCALKKFYMENASAYLARLKELALEILNVLER